jgi:hypothetical protein
MILVLDEIGKGGGGKIPYRHGSLAQFWLRTLNQKYFFCISSRNFSSAAPIGGVPSSDSMCQ